MKVKFSKLTVFKLERLNEYLINKWSVQTKNKFLKKLNSRIEIIAENPEIFPSSSIDPKLRKCIVTKQSTLLYEIHSDFIFVVNLIDNRQDKKTIHEEIKKHNGQHQPNEQ